MPPRHVHATVTPASDETSLSVPIVFNKISGARWIHHHLPFLASVCLLVEFIVCCGTLNAEVRLF